MSPLSLGLVGFGRQTQGTKSKQCMKGFFLSPCTTGKEWGCNDVECSCDMKVPFNILEACAKIALKF